MSFVTENQPGVVADAPAATRGFVLNHSMLRVKDPQVSLAFYTGIMGMKLLRKLDFPEMKFSLYFLHRPVDGETPPDDGIVEPGMVVTVEMFDEEETFLLGHREIQDHTDLHVFSEVSPLGAAVNGKKAGDTVTYEAPNGKTVTVKILKASPYTS